MAYIKVFQSFLWVIVLTVQVSSFALVCNLSLVELIVDQPAPEQSSAEASGEAPNE